VDMNLMSTLGMFRCMEYSLRYLFGLVDGLGKGVGEDGGEMQVKG